MPSKPTLEAKIASVVEMIHVPVGVVKNIRNVVYVNSASTLVDRITMETKLCSNCGETMLCGANQTTESCWLFRVRSKTQMPIIQITLRH